MKAVQISAYGDRSVLKVNTNSPKPSLKQGQILVENEAAGINPVDWKFRAGYLQKMAPVSLPVILGGDFAGTVIEIGEGVSAFKIGDEVYGQAIILNGGSGSFAQFVAANCTNTARKPKSSTFEQAAALPLAGVSALTALEDHMKLKRGQKMLIHGGAGGIGSLAIQIAKAKGAYVATTVAARDVDFVKELGADEVIDYKTQQFEKILKGFDAAFDTVGGEITNKSFQVLKKGGILVSMTGQPDQENAQTYGVFAIGQGTNTDTAHLTRLTELVDSGKVNVIIDRVFQLKEVQKAFAYQETGHPRGKVVLRIK